MKRNEFSTHLDCPSKRNWSLRLVCEVSLQTGVGSCRRPVGQCQNSFLWQKIPQPQDISAISYMTHNTSAFLQPTLCPHFFPAYALEITGLRAVRSYSLSAALVAPRKHNQEQELCWHKLQNKRPDTKSHQELVFSPLPVAPPSTSAPIPKNTPLDIFRDLNCCCFSRCRPPADKATEIVTFANSQIHYWNVLYEIATSAMLSQGQPQAEPSNLQQQHPFPVIYAISTAREFSQHILLPPMQAPCCMATWYIREISEEGYEPCQNPRKSEEKEQLGLEKRFMA